MRGAAILVDIRDAARETRRTGPRIYAKLCVLGDAGELRKDGNKLCEILTGSRCLDQFCRLFGSVVS